MVRASRHVSLRLAQARPPGEQQEHGQREQHAVHDQSDGIDPIAIRQLDDDGLAGEGDGAESRQQQAAAPRREQ